MVLLFKLGKILIKCTVGPGTGLNVLIYFISELFIVTLFRKLFHKLKLFCRIRICKKNSGYATLLTTLTSSYLTSQCLRMRSQITLSKNTISDHIV